MIQFTPNDHQLRWDSAASMIIDCPERGVGKTTYMLALVANQMIQRSSNYIFVTPLASDTGGFKYHSQIVEAMLGDHGVRTVPRGRKIICEAPNGVSVLMFYTPASIMRQVNHMTGISGAFIDEAQHLPIMGVRQIMSAMRFPNGASTTSGGMPFAMIGDSGNNDQEFKVMLRLPLYDTTLDDKQSIIDRIENFRATQTKGRSEVRMITAMDFMTETDDPACAQFMSSFEIERDAILFKMWFSEYL